MRRISIAVLQFQLKMNAGHEEKLNLRGDTVLVHVQVDRVSMRGISITYLIPIREEEHIKEDILLLKRVEVDQDPVVIKGVKEDTLLNVTTRKRNRGNNQILHVGQVGINQ